MANANLNKVIELARGVENKKDPDYRIGYRADGDNAILILPSYVIAGGDLGAMKEPAARVELIDGGTLRDHMLQIHDALGVLAGVIS